MTCIVGFIEPDRNRVWIGGDSAGSTESFITDRADEKVFHNGGYFFGFSGSFRRGQVLRYAFNPPVPTPSDVKSGMMKFLCTTFVEEWRSALVRACCSSSEDHHGTIIGAYQSFLFRVDTDFQIAISREGIAGCGTGMCEAMAVLHATAADAALPPFDRMTLALSTSAYYNPTVRGPFTILHTY